MGGLISARLDFLAMNTVSHIFIGPAGWSCPDWRGIVYPLKRPHGFSELAFISNYFPIVEINSTFYSVPTLKTVEGWLKTVSPRPAFRFCVKLWQGFTHGESFAEAETFRERLKPMVGEGRLTALLLQFPWSFKRTQTAFDRLQKILDAMSGLPCAVEFRHASWQSAECDKLLADRSVAFVNIDQPIIGESIVPSAKVTAPFAYVRLHGRNAENWFRNGAGRDARYDYLYRPKELQAWSESITEMAQTAPVIVIFNNHFRGQAVANAFQLERLLTGKAPRVPSTLFACYSQQLAGAVADEPSGTLPLF